MEVREQLKELEEKVSKGLQKAYIRMTELKKQKKTPMVVFRNGKVVSIPPEEILPTTKAMNPPHTSPSHNQTTDQSEHSESNN